MKDRYISSGAQVGPVAPRTLLFIRVLDVIDGDPAGPCEELVAAYPDEVAYVLAKKQRHCPNVRHTARSARPHYRTRHSVRNRRRKAMRPLPASATDEEIANELRRLAEQPNCPPDVREHVLGVLHDHEIELREARTRVARKAAAKTLDEIERLSKAK
jgi:hypothetical protein